MAQGIGQVIVRAKGEVPNWVDGSIDEIVPKLSAPDARARILNIEASVVFVRTPISDSDLRFYWAANESRAFSKGVNPSIIYPHPNPDVGRRFERLEDPGILEALYEKGFFQDESCPGRTTIVCWDKKRHSRIARLGFPRKEQLFALLEYGRVVGFIPIIDEAENGKPLGGLEVFRDHWQQRVGLGESRAVASLAWTAARSVRRGYFDDAEYDLVQISNEMEPGK